MEGKDSGAVEGTPCSISKYTFCSADFRKSRKYISQLTNRSSGLLDSNEAIYNAFAP